MQNQSSITKAKNGGYSYPKEGWTYMSISGNAKDRGYDYGFLSAPEFKDIQNMLAFFIPETYGVSWPDIIKEIMDDYGEPDKNFKEFYDEMQGIAEGCSANGTPTTFDEIFAWNFYSSLSYWYEFKSENHVGKEGGGLRGGKNIFKPSAVKGSRARDRCSAFIAVGKDFTADGNIVCSHNSFCDFVDGQYCNVILNIKPDKGTAFMMQTAPCWIWSGTDFFVTEKGMFGTETTIGGFYPFEKKIPIMFRIRQAMQYGKDLDDYEKILTTGNSGDYANSWLFGDTRTNEIMRIELGLKYVNTERTKNGFFIGFNAPYDPKIRNLECNNSGFYDIRRHQGARQVRLGDLMKQYKGQLNAEIAQKIISDHYDVYLNKENPCSRTVCSHYDLDAREYMSQADRPKPYAPHGALDGAVIDTNMIQNKSFMIRSGNSCGMVFDKDDFCDKHPQWEVFRPYLKTRPGHPWVLFKMDDGSNTNPTDTDTSTIINSASDLPQGQGQGQSAQPYNQSQDQSQYQGQDQRQMGGKTRRRFMKRRKTKKNK